MVHLYKDVIKGARFPFEEKGRDLDPLDPCSSAPDFYRFRFQGITIHITV